MAIRRFTPKVNFSTANFDGQLLAITPSSYDAAANVMIGDVVVCDGPNAGEVHKGLRIVQLSLIDALKEGGPHETTVFRLTVGVSKAGNPLAVLNEPTEADYESAEAVLASL